MQTMIYRILLTSFSDSCILVIVLFVSFDIDFNRLPISMFSLPVVDVEPPLFALNVEHIDAFPNELYAILLKPDADSSTVLPCLADVDDADVADVGDIADVDGTSMSNL